MASTTSSTAQHLVSTSTVAPLPPIITDTNARRQSRGRSSSYAKDRLSTHSNLSLVSQNRSRPGSHVFPIFHSSLPYSLVRDFAYPPTHPLHYGPLPLRASRVSTPASEQRRLSDPPAPWDASRGQWSTGPWSTDHSYGHQQLPAMSFGDGPPYSEDEDLHSPVFSAPRHRKNKSTGTDLNGGRGRSSSGAVGYLGDDRGTFMGTNADGSETYYVNEEEAADDGPGGEYVTYPVNESRYSHMGASGGDQEGHGADAGFDSEDDYTGNRYSRDFQFAVGCPDEEMHGKAVALFDFTREHENELPLTEGQVIFVSYRHGQGWLVAEDPRTGESGLVPEEFVRLLRDIEGGLTSLNGGPDADQISPESTDSQQALTPTQDDEHSAVYDQENTHVSNGETTKDRVVSSTQPVATSPEKPTAENHVSAPTKT
ncbi:HOG (high osmolarity glycerol) pathway protein [Aspergillus nanangensis]|uniref:HOG (High osmolarity glycerol) pathway protein n=1 Tax=Aspergillus nanangensis TaxID=2582783 RepID=A0AAD4GPC9_ASPNN|nr:HOG (high osmolarity glycerol) pathway protein [Aspergillus nanangensis]